MPGLAYIFSCTVILGSPRNRLDELINFVALSSIAWWKTINRIASNDPCVKNLKPVSVQYYRTSKRQARGPITAF